MISPIATRYAGYCFRSRLEARWAVFFSTLGVAWSYESEGFVLADGTRYVPDFWLPWPEGEQRGWAGAGYWVEIKPRLVSDADIEKCRGLATGSGHSVLLCAGLPTDDQIHYIGRDGVHCPPDARMAVRSLGIHGWDENEIPGAAWTRFTDDHCRIISAGEAALSARFEHGHPGA
jgi:hypothetical protein